MAANVLKHGTRAGMGGSETAAVISAVYKVDVLTYVNYQRTGGRFKLQVACTGAP